LSVELRRNLNCRLLRALHVIQPRLHELLIRVTPRDFCAVRLTEKFRQPNCKIA